MSAPTIAELRDAYATAYANDQPLDHASAWDTFYEEGQSGFDAGLAAHDRAVEAEALREAAEVAEDVINSGDIAECAAYVPGETGRNEAVSGRDSLYEEPVEWLRARADQIEAANQ